MIGGVAVAKCVKIVYMPEERLDIQKEHLVPKNGNGENGGLARRSLGEGGSKIKRIIFVVLGLGFAGLASYFLSRFNSAPGTSTGLVAGVFLMLFLVAASFQALAIKEPKWSIPLAFFETIVFLAPLFSQLKGWAYFGALIFFIALTFSFARAWADADDHLKFNFRRFSKVSVTFAATGLAIFLAFFYAGVYQTEGVSFMAFKFITAGTTPIIGRFVPGFTENMSADEFFKVFVKSQAGSRPGLAMVPASVKEQAISQLAVGLKNQTVAVTKTAPTADESFIHYLYRVVNHYLSELNKGYLKIFAIFGIALIIFFILQTILFLLKWPVLFLAYLIYRLLLGLGVIYLTREPCERETIVV